MNANNTYTETLSKAASVLKEMRPFISSDDRIEAEKKLDVSQVTIIRYLNGQVKKINTATDLIQFFKKKIEERQRIIEAAA